VLLLAGISEAEAAESCRIRCVAIGPSKSITCQPGQTAQCSCPVELFGALGDPKVECVDTPTSSPAPPAGASCSLPAPPYNVIYCPAAGVSWPFTGCSQSCSAGQQAICQNFECNNSNDTFNAPVCGCGAGRDLLRRRGPHGHYVEFQFTAGSGAATVPLMLYKLKTGSEVDGTCPSNSSAEACAAALANLATKNAMVSVVSGKNVRIFVDPDYGLEFSVGPPSIIHCLNVNDADATSRCVLPSGDM
jgi:hypothetical protein